MKWSRGPKRIFDGGAIGRDTINVFRPDRMEKEGLSVFAFRDAKGVNTADLLAGQDDKSPPPDQTLPPAITVAKATPSGPTAEEVQQREDAAFEAGRQEGMKELDAHLARLSEQLEGAVSFFHETLSRVDAQASRQSLELALVVAERLFRRSIEVEPDRLVAAVEELATETSNEGALRILVDPATAKHWRSHDESLRELLGDRPFEVESKDDLTVGDIIVHCGSLTLDERIAHRVQQYARAIEQELGMPSEK